eukprot:1645301-Lingulodinium_polyedra.AAC.1
MTAPATHRLVALGVTVRHQRRRTRFTGAVLRRGRRRPLGPCWALRGHGQSRGARVSSGGLFFLPAPA